MEIPELTAARGEHLVEFGCIPVLLAVVEVEGQQFVPTLLLVIYVDVKAALDVLIHAVAQCFVWSPFTILPRMPCFVHVISVHESRHARGFCKAKPEETTHIAVFCASCSFGISHISLLVLTFQVHIHHKILLLHLSSQPFAFLGRFAVNLHLFDRIERQILQHHLVPAFEEVLAVECEIIDLLAIDKDGAVVLQFHAWHLAHQRIKHGAFGQQECRGIIDDGVVLIDHLDARSFDHHLVKGFGCGDGVTTDRP